MSEHVYEVSDVGTVENFFAEEEIPEVKKPEIRKAVKRAAGRTGRSAFVDPICKEHPDWEHDDGTVVIADGVTVNCAKFAHLPGRGRGVFQPGILQILKSGASDIVKPVVFLGLLSAAFFILTHFLGSGGILQPKHGVSVPKCSVSASSGPTPSVSPSVHSGSDSCGSNGRTSFLHVDPAVK